MRMNPDRLGDLGSLRRHCGVSRQQLKARIDPVAISFRLKDAEMQRALNIDIVEILRGPR